MTWYLLQVCNGKENAGFRNKKEILGEAEIALNHLEHDEEMTFNDVPLLAHKCKVSERGKKLGFAVKAT